MSTPNSGDSFEVFPLTPALIEDLRSDHAGKLGTVGIYRGILEVTKDSSVSIFARGHPETQGQHSATNLTFMQET